MGTGVISHPRRGTVKAGRRNRPVVTRPSSLWFPPQTQAGSPCYYPDSLQPPYDNEYPVVGAGGRGNPGCALGADRGGGKFRAVAGERVEVLDPVLRPR